MKRKLFTAAFVVILSFYIVPAQAYENTPIGYASMPGNPNDSNYYNEGGTTGGGNATPIIVTTTADFNAAATSGLPAVIYVQGDLTVGEVRLGSDKTIIGIDPNATLRGDISIFNEVHNIIIRNLYIRNDSGAGESDCITMKATGDSQPPPHHVWVDHCNLYNSTDGIFDITQRSDYVTVSWCKFYYTSTTVNPSHRFTNLIGASDNDPCDAGHLRVTFHHNWWGNLCDQRMPRVRFGQVHIYNNYYGCSGNTYCIGVGKESQLRVENNYFDDVETAWRDPASTPGKIGWNTGNVFVSTSIPTTFPNDYNDPNKVFVPPYSYTLDDGANVKSLVTNGAGVDSNDFFPHWLFGPYGEFDHSGTVDMKDFSQFVDYWLVNDPNQIADADYNGDGIVNFYEFALFAENWLKEP